MPATMTTVDGLLKEVYGPRLVNQLQNETLALKRIEKSKEGITETAGGKYVNFPLKVARNSGIGYRNEMEALYQQMIQFGSKLASTELEPALMHLVVARFPNQRLRELHGAAYT